MTPASSPIDQKPCNGCTACVHRCTEGIPLTRDEYRAMRDHLLSVPARDRARVLSQCKTRSWPGSGGEALYTACRFLDLDSGLCLVYNARPLVCRLFGHVDWLPCPVGKVRADWPGGLEAMRARESTQHTWDEWEAQSVTP